MPKAGSDRSQQSTVCQVSVLALILDDSDATGQEQSLSHPVHSVPTTESGMETALNKCWMMNGWMDRWWTGGGWMMDS